MTASAIILHGVNADVSTRCGSGGRPRGTQTEGKRSDAIKAEVRLCTNALASALNWPAATTVAGICTAAGDQIIQPISTSNTNARRYRTGYRLPPVAP